MTTKLKLQMQSHVQFLGHNEFPDSDSKKIAAVLTHLQENFVVLNNHLAQGVYMGSFGEIVNRMIKDKDLDAADGSFGTWSSDTSTFTVGRCDYKVLPNETNSDEWTEDGENWEVTLGQETFKILHV